MKNENEKKGLFARLSGNKKTKKNSCCNIELEEICEDEIKDTSENDQKEKSDNSCCNK